MGGGFSVLAQGAAVQKGLGLGGDVADRTQVYVYVQTGQQLALGLLHRQTRFQTVPGIAVPGGGEGLFAKGGIPADPGDGAALLVHGDQQREPGRSLVGCQSLPKGIWRLSVKVPSKQHEAPQMVLPDILQRGIAIAPGQKQLSHPLFQGHLLQQLLDRVFWFCGDGGLDHRDFCRDCGLYGFYFFCCFLRPMGGAAGEQQQCQEKNKIPHGFHLPQILP